MLPETLKLLPIYTLGLIKHRGFRAGIFVTTDGIEHGIDESVNGNLERSYVLRAMSVMSTEHIVPFCYPRMYQAWPYPDEVCLLMDPETSCQLLQSPLTELPPSLNLSAERLQQQGAFLITDTTCIYLWLARDISATFLECVFGVRSFESLTPNEVRGSYYWLIC